jgi:hypothetical protein
MDKNDKEKDKFVRFDKVKKNQEMVEKLKKDRITHILGRSTKKEQFRDKFFKTKKLVDGDKKDKRGQRLRAAMMMV